MLINLEMDNQQPSSKEKVQRLSLVRGVGPSGSKEANLNT
nr:MAG TPA: hypothetical protein [Bacteriophage sp.]